MNTAWFTAILVFASLFLVSPASAHVHRHHYYRHHNHVLPTLPRDAGLVTVETAAKIPITVAAAVASKFQDLIADLVEHGYMPKDIGCYARGGHIPHSFHYRGLACDIDQISRNRGSRFMHTKEAHEIIHQHGLDDGCDFGDCGHVSLGEIGHAYATMARRGHVVHYAGRRPHTRIAATTWNYQERPSEERSFAAW